MNKSVKDLIILMALQTVKSIIYFFLLPENLFYVPPTT